MFLVSLSARPRAALVGIALSACGFVLVQLFRKRRRIPPVCPLSTRETLREMTARGTPPGWLYRMRRTMGTSVFCLRIPSWEYFVVVCDSETARTILMDPQAEKGVRLHDDVQVCNTHSNECVCFGKLCFISLHKPATEHIQHVQRRNTRLQRPCVFNTSGTFRPTDV